LVDVAVGQIFFSFHFGFHLRVIIPPVLHTCLSPGTGTTDYMTKELSPYF